MKRPTSITVVGWFLLIAHAFMLMSYAYALHNPMALQAFNRFAFPVWVTVGFGVLAQLVTILAAIGILKGRKWGRNAYLGISVLGMLLAFFNMPSTLMLLPGLVVFVLIAFLLLRLPATAYFNRQPVPAA